MANKPFSSLVPAAGLFNLFEKCFEREKEKGEKRKTGMHCEARVFSFVFCQHVPDTFLLQLRTTPARSLLSVSSATLSFTESLSLSFSRFMFGLSYLKKKRCF